MLALFCYFLLFTHRFFAANTPDMQSAACTCSNSYFKGNLLFAHVTNKILQSLRKFCFDLMLRRLYLYLLIVFYSTLLSSNSEHFLSEVNKFILSARFSLFHLFSSRYA